MKVIGVLRDKVKSLRNTLHLIEGQEFLAIYEKAAKHEKEKADVFAQEGNIQNLKIWMREQSGDYTLIQLKEQARAAGVSNWSRMDKEELIRAIYSGEASSPVRKNPSGSSQV